MWMTGADAIIYALKEEGIKAVFGLPGGGVLPLYDALYQSELLHILMRHEQGAVHAADGYARATGDVGVCLATSGPGATNLVTGLATAHLDSIPLVAITGNVPRSVSGTDAFQEADIFSITQAVTKHNYRVQTAGALLRALRHGFHIARTGRPGPVLIDVPKDILTEKHDYAYPNTLDLPGYHPESIELDDLPRAAGALLTARRPVFYVGGGVKDPVAIQILQRLAETYGIPVTTTLMGLGSFPPDHPLFLGMPGMHGTYCANMALSNTDCLVAVGTRFDDRVTGKTAAFARDAFVIHLDIDAAEMGKIRVPDVSLTVDARRGLEKLATTMGNDAATKNAPRGHLTSAWIRQLSQWRSDHSPTFNTGDSGLLPQQVIQTLDQLADDERIIVTGVGQHQMWAAQHCRVRHPRRFLTSGGLGTMGFGLPAAIGAQVAYPDHQVIGIDGDGSLQMTLQELASVAQYALPIKLIVINNAAYGMVRQWQQLFFDQRFSHSQLPATPDFVQLAQSYGIPGFRIETADHVASILEEALAQDGPVLVDCQVKHDEGVFPMVPPGASLSEMWEEEPKC